MQILTPRVDLAAFFEQVTSASSAVLMLDYDGTLAPFHVQPERAYPYPEVAAILQGIQEAGHTRVVIVSGRPADDVVPLLSLSPQPEIWGSHGWERLLSDGRRIVEEPDENARCALKEGFSAVAGFLQSGARVEHKLASVALHWRGLSQLVAQDLHERTAAAWTPLAAGGALEVLSFDGGLELRSVGCNKQVAVKAVLAETSPARAVAYLGDDITDEDAFRAIKTRGLGVLVRPECRPTAADVWLKPPHELVTFLRHWNGEENAR